MGIADALALVPDGCELGVGGILMTRKPVALLDAIGRSRRGLTLSTLLGSLDAEILAAHNALSGAKTIYVGFEQLGSAPAYEQGVARGEIAAAAYSELLFIGGLRASIAGLPFLPTRGAEGSDVAAELKVQTVTCPYTGEQLLAARAVRPDVAILHAEAADNHGNVLGSAERDFLFDFDANIARAAVRVVASVERVAGAEEMRRRRRDVLLFGHEVDAVVVMPGGARPSALPGVHRADLQRLRAYLARTRDLAPLDALDVLISG